MVLECPVYLVLPAQETFFKNTTSQIKDDLNTACEISDAYVHIVGLLFLVCVDRHAPTLLLSLSTIYMPNIYTYMPY